MGSYSISVLEISASEIIPQKTGISRDKILLENQSHTSHLWFFCLFSPFSLFTFASYFPLGFLLFNFYSIQLTPIHNQCSTFLFTFLLPYGLSYVFHFSHGEQSPFKAVLIKLSIGLDLCRPCGITKKLQKIQPDPGRRLIPVHPNPGPSGRGLSRMVDLQL